MDRLAIFSWCLYDWANSAFPTAICPFIFGTYYSQGVAESPAQGASDWGWALGAAPLFVAVASP